MIYLDNSATTYPKPLTVVNAFNNAVKQYGANSGRGAYKMALDTSSKIFETRKKAADFFGMSQVQNVVFTYNCTAALNTAIKGIARKGGHFVISDLEHNAVLRVVEKLRADGVCTYSVAEVMPDDIDTVHNFSNAIRTNTLAVICTGASNVFGIIPPYKAIAQVAHDHGVPFILDGAQLCGIKDINMEKDGIDIMCCAGHKGLYGLSGTGLLLINSDITLDTLIEGGTGSNSASAKQPDVLPDRFESGTPNVPGIISLGAGIDFVTGVTTERIFYHETKVIEQIRNNLQGHGKIRIYCGEDCGYKRLAPILSMNIDGIHSEEFAERLSRMGICVRAGMHCAPIAHKKMGTESVGTVRISPSCFTQKNDVDFLIKCVIKIAK